MGQKSRQKKDKSKNKQGSAPKQKVQQVVAAKPLNLASLSGEPIEKKPVVANKTLQFGELTDHIRTDIIRISMLLVFVIILLIVLVEVNNRTTLLLTAGQHLSNFLRLQS